MLRGDYIAGLQTGKRQQELLLKPAQSSGTSLPLIAPLGLRGQAGHQLILKYEEMNDLIL